ncbi:hypothetical protein HELRODRAFT_181653 [Helobdella robusta]|uniref:G-protein coupled receptors family 1 profile domain-containing protein n=1 Tax=Helobdella robusta TaxID=6412 RepID=T1FH73_HELRO|nr:hypothetical protein HELRODRAFT_181653 [Helobdella robusta]ESN92183.1 hypothetical protein HELRODRAFT_181653 [Helobdella robusta]
MSSIPLLNSDNTPTIDIIASTSNSSFSPSSFSPSSLSPLASKATSSSSSSSPSLTDTPSSATDSNSANTSITVMEQIFTTTVEAGGSGGEPMLRYPLWEACIILIFCLIIILGTIVGNILVCIAVSIVRKLRTPSNLLIVSLAVADLLVALVVMPLAAMYEVMGVWKLGQVMCDVWTSSDVLLCTASILNLCMISVDRYFVITRPFDYAMKRTPGLMAVMILSVWLLSALISIPPLFGWKSDTQEDVCELSQAIGYQFYATIGAFYLPLTVMIIIYYRIYAVSSRIHKKELKSNPEHKQLRSASSFSSTSSSFGRKMSDHPPPPHHHQHDQHHRQSSGNDDWINKKRKISMESSSSRKPCLHGRGSNQSENSKKEGEDSNVQATNSPTTLTVPDPTIQIINPPPSPASKALRKHLKNVSFLSKPNSSGALNKMHSASKERKTTKTLGIIMGAFVVCWLPFFILALIRPFLTDPTVIPHWLVSLLQWLGFANSFLNPIIYARFNRDFRKPFKAILFCKCIGINTHLRSEKYTEDYGPSNTEFSSGVFRRNSQQVQYRNSFQQQRNSGSSFDGYRV